jgi:phosphate transport system protein
MREKFQDELQTLLDRLNNLVSLVQRATRHSNTALLGADGDLAAAVIRDDAAVVQGQSDVDAVALDILVREQPVATDLRTVVACLRMSVDLRRMGKLSTHLAEIAQAHLPGHAVPEELRPIARAMAGCAQQILAGAARAIATRDDKAAAELERADDAMDRLQQELYHAAFAAPSRTAQDIIDIALIGRYYERYADHAVALAREVAYLVGTSPLDAAPAGT